jgi:hypothetical protein
MNASKRMSAVPACRRDAEKWRHAVRQFCLNTVVALGYLSACSWGMAQARVWTDATGHFTLEAELIAVGNKTVVLKRADHELVAIPLEQLSAKDREHLKSPEAGEIAKRASVGRQSWTLRDGTMIAGRVVDYTSRELTIQRRRGTVFVNDRRLENLPEFYQQLLPQIVGHFENLDSADRRGFEAWVLRQRGQPRTFQLKGIVLESENGDEYAVPFFLLSDQDQNVLGASFDEWLASQRGDDYDQQHELAFLLQSLAAARYRDQMVQREIALMNLKLQAVTAGLTSLWEVSLYPPVGHGGRPVWVVVPGRNSDQATAAALEQWPGFFVGPIRRLTR